MKKLGLVPIALGVFAFAGAESNAAGSGRGCRRRR